MKVKTKICLISALTAISAPAIMTTVSCSPDERQDNTISIIMNNENVGISSKKAVKMSPCIFLCDQRMVIGCLCNQ